MRNWSMFKKEGKAK